MNKKKRSLSESSDDPDDPGVFDPSPGSGYNPLAGGYNPSAGDYSSSGGLPGFKRPNFEGSGRRISQASTASSLSGPEDEAGGLDRDVESLDKALGCSSSSDTEDDAAHQGFAGKDARQQGFSSNGTLPYAEAKTSYSPSKKMKSEPAPAAKSGDGGKSGNYSSAAEKMMAMMGYKSGTGLGKAQQGRVEPVGLSNQRGRRGLGHIIEGLEADTALDWAPEEVLVKERLVWMKPNQEPAPTENEFRNWIEMGSRNEDISGETRYCEPQVLKDVLSCKSVFDKLEAFEMMKARSRSNPFETIAKGIFQNRAAMKMANMDTVLDYMFTDPRDEEGRSLIGENEPLYFADVCAGPGGFSEYVLWRKKWRAKGYGFTLKDTKHDFKLEDFYAGPPEGFETYYGVGGDKGDGNVFRTDNILELQRFILANTNQKGVHFMMADGGFSVEGSENIQEILSKQLYLCQCIVALGVVRTQGHFVCKLFDLFTPFSVGLVYLMYRAFKKVCIYKPNTSRPANSERYIVCKWRKPDTEHIFRYLLEVNDKLNDLDFSILGRTRSRTDILGIVPESVLAEDSHFIQYMVDSNNQIGQNQVTGLEKIAVFYRNTTLYEKRQAEVRRECLEYWNVPDQGRIRPRFEDARDMASRLLSSSSLLRETETVLRSQEDLRKYIKSVYDWKFVVIGSQEKSNDSQSQNDMRAFLISTGRQRVSIYYPERANWKSISSSCTLELPAETLLFVELVWEMKGESKAQKKVMGVHVIDALFLAGEDVRNMHFMQRHKLCSLFLRVMNKPSRSYLTRIRMKEVFKLEDLSSNQLSVWNHLDHRSLKGRGEALVLNNNEQDPDGSTKFFQAKGLLLYKHVKDPFFMALSRKFNKKYYFNSRTNEPVENFATPPAGIAEFEPCHVGRLVWYWNTFPDEKSNDVNRAEFDEFVVDKLNGR